MVGKGRRDATRHRVIVWLEAGSARQWSVIRQEDRRNLVGRIASVRRLSERPAMLGNYDTLFSTRHSKNKHILVRCVYINSPVNHDSSSQLLSSPLSQVIQVTLSSRRTMSTQLDSTMKHATSEALAVQLELPMPPVVTADLTGKTVVVTGANIGLGFEAAKHLARMNPKKLIIAVRSKEKGEETVKGEY
jgi:FlaA1/EpsC-like NDP-sugar epimerase